jgi:hypothetical protein
MVPPSGPLDVMARPWRLSCWCRAGTAARTRHGGQPNVGADPDVPDGAHLGRLNLGTRGRLKSFRAVCSLEADWNVGSVPDRLEDAPRIRHLLERRSRGKLPGSRTIWPDSRRRPAGGTAAIWTPRSSAFQAAASNPGSRLRSDYPPARFARRTARPLHHVEMKISSRERLPRNADRSRMHEGAIRQLTSAGLRQHKRNNSKILRGLFVLLHAYFTQALSE